MNWRDVRRTDLDECLKIDPRSMGEAVVGHERGLALWSRLLRHRAFHGALIESYGDVIAGFGASVFVRRDYADRELREPRPDINSRIFAAYGGGEPVLRAEDSLVDLEATDGLDLLLMCSSFAMERLHAEQQVEVSILLPKALVHLHVGYRIERILMETTNERMRALAAASGVWKMVAHFPEDDRALFVVTREEGLGLAGFGLLGPLFHYRAPVLGLRDAEKELLCQAVHGETDVELAVRLNLSVSSVKKRWTTLFAHIAAVQPELLPQKEQALQKEGRGMQKRHHVLAYVREHPEEIRPFGWYPS